MPSARLPDLGALSVVYTPICFVRCHPQSPGLEALYGTELSSVTSGLVSIEEVDNLK